MNCTEWEERIALYAGGDLTLPQAGEVERHLGECPGCQVFSSGLAESLAALRTAHSAEIAPGHYTALRARVMAGVERERRGRWRAWVWAAAAAAIVLLAIGAGLRMRVEELPAVALRIASPPPTAWQTARTAGPAPRPHRAHPVARQPKEQVLVKVETDNPDVVILWITETKGEN
jgi:anti-sigma factor RsiW